MTNGELIDILSTFPRELTVWHSDGGYVEGAARSIAPIKILANEASLDGDEIEDEIRYTKFDAFWKEEGYQEVAKDFLVKEIILLQSTLD